MTFLGPGPLVLMGKLHTFSPSEVSIHKLTQSVPLFFTYFSTDDSQHILEDLFLPHYDTDHFWMYYT